MINLNRTCDYCGVIAPILNKEAVLGIKGKFCSELCYRFKCDEINDIVISMMSKQVKTKEIKKKIKASKTPT